MKSAIYDLEHADHDHREGEICGDGHDSHSHGSEEEDEEFDNENLDAHHNVGGTAILGFEGGEQITSTDNHDHYL